MNTSAKVIAGGFLLAALATAFACGGSNGTRPNATTATNPTPVTTAAAAGTTAGQTQAGTTAPTGPAQTATGGTAGQSQSAASASGVSGQTSPQSGNTAPPVSPAPVSPPASRAAVPAVAWQRLTSPYGGFQIMAPAGWTLSPVADDESTVEVVSPDHARTGLALLWSKVADLYVTGTFDPLDYSKQWGAEEFLHERLLPIERMMTDPNAQITSVNAISPTALEFTMNASADGVPLVAEGTLEVVNSPFPEMSFLVGGQQFLSEAVVTWCDAPADLLSQVELLCPRVLLSFTPNANWGAAGAQNSQMIAQFGADMRSMQYQQFQSMSEWQAYNGRMLTNALGGTTDYSAGGLAYTGLMNDYAPYHYEKADTIYPSDTDPISFGETPAIPCTWPHC
ncbi:MAG TPA: hypothetical protein VFT91_01190 [Dehalococcoidia bacterium]|nr:hypothetical protein [Dehalococcoidia bacterium]